MTHVLASREHTAIRFGFIVSKQVGNAVVRNRVRRRLKAVCAAELSLVPPGTEVVIRALPTSATADFHQLHAEVQRCLRRAA